jgi:peptidoglycan hydrolase-like protein with peptidoglycan-binding domain
LPRSPGPTFLSSMKYLIPLLILISSSAFPQAKKPAGRVQMRRSLQPAPNRFREIQSALAARGYLTTPPSGVWDKNAIAAMQRFQQAQKLEPTGRLTARSLQALGSAQ